MKSTFPTLRFEKNLWNKGLSIVAGIDEVGRGSYAGPVVAAAAIFEPSIEEIIPKSELRLVRDSKLLSTKRRSELSHIIKQVAKAYYIAEIGVEYINQNGIGQACQEAFTECAVKLMFHPEHILIDAFRIKSLDEDVQTPIVKGDLKCFSIAAASIIAKDYRDNLMNKLSKKYPQFELEKNKGYGTKKHRSLIDQYGLSEIHRRSFKIGPKLALAE